VLLLVLLACVVLAFDILLADVATPTLDYRATPSLVYRFCLLFSHDTLDALIMILSLYVGILAL
jgi:hypothetical protein